MPCIRQRDLKRGYNNLLTDLTQTDIPGYQVKVFDAQTDRWTEGRMRFNVPFPIKQKWDTVRNGRGHKGGYSLVDN